MPLKLSCATTDPSKASTDLLALGVFVGDTISTTAPVDALDEMLGGSLAELIQRQEFTGKKDQTLEVETLGRLPARRLLLVGLGVPADLTLAALRTFAARAGRTANASKAQSLALGIAGKLDAEQARALAEGVVLGAYRFSKYLTGDRKPKAELTAATLLTTGKLDKIKKAADLGFRIGTCVCYARDLINEPPNELTPIALATFAQSVAKSHKLSCKVFDGKAIEKMGMKLFIAVAQGSANEPR
ncbi:MAG: leucyl aminopeptidase, partial [Deltaproteobacteria bacterium HGW-Deltaproteobacteria-20]